MNYYDDLLKKIDKLYKENDLKQLEIIVNDELNAPYIPSDVENKLNEYKLLFMNDKSYNKSLTDEQILEYLSKDDKYQLIAVDELNKRNLRDYIDIIQDYLKENRYKNAKSLLIDSLIKQEINYEFEYVNDSLLLKFNPSKLKIVELTDGFISGSEILKENYMQDPSKLNLAMQLLYKEAMLYLPKQASKQEGIICANKIITYIENAFLC